VNIGQRNVCRHAEASAADARGEDGVRAACNVEAVAGDTARCTAWAGFSDRAHGAAPPARPVSGSQLLQVHPNLLAVQTELFLAVND